MGKQNNDQTITFLNNHHPAKAQEKITAVFEFNQNGYLKTVFLNSKSSKDQLVLERGIERLISPHRFGWLRRLFR